MAALEKIKVHQLDGPVGQIDSIVEGENVTVDVTDPRNPVINAQGSIDSIIEGENVTVDVTDPRNPVISATVPPLPVPLTTVVGGEPQLVWDNENNLVMTTEGA